MTESQAEEKSEAEVEVVLAMFMEQLDVDEEVASILTQEGFSTIEEVAYVPPPEMLQIEEFEEDIVAELQARAKDVMLTRAIASEEGLSDARPAEDLLALEGMPGDLAHRFASHGIVTREDLAEQSVDDLQDISDIDPKLAGELIMAARAVWFEDEEQS